MALLTVHHAAERLGVTNRQVQHLAALGDLRMLARGVVDEDSVDRFLAVRGAARTRAWSGATAWGAVALLSGVQPVWLGRDQRSRLRGRLRATSAVELVGRSRARGVARRLAGHSSAVARARRELVDLAGAAASLGLAEVQQVDAYVARAELDDVVQRYGLVDDPRGDFVLRATDWDMETVAELARAATVLAALDLAESLDARERQAGLDGLTEALERFRG